MLVQADQECGKPAHVIVVGNEKGGSGKSTIAVHVAIALTKAGYRVATIDLDPRQKSLTRFIENRIASAKRWQLHLEMPMHYCIARSDEIRADDSEVAEFNSFHDKISVVEQSHDLVVIDTPGSDTYLMRLAHAMADTLITPLNDSFVDFDVLGVIDPVTSAVTAIGHYCEMVRDLRREHRKVDRHETDWIVVRNRLHHRRFLDAGLNDLGLQLGFRCARGLSERLIYQELFPFGLTVFDAENVSTPRIRPNGPRAGLQEVEALLSELKLPIDAKGRRRAAARSEWFANGDKPLDVSDALG
jgi:chromosome partitioning protein